MGENDLKSAENVPKMHFSATLTVEITNYSRQLLERNQILKIQETKIWRRRYGLVTTRRSFSKPF